MGKRRRNKKNKINADKDRSVNQNSDKDTNLFRVDVNLHVYMHDETILHKEEDSSNKIFSAFMSFVMPLLLSSISVCIHVFFIGEFDFDFVTGILLAIESSLGVSYFIYFWSHFKHGVDNGVKNSPKYGLLCIIVIFAILYVVTLVANEVCKESLGYFDVVSAVIIVVLVIVSIFFFENEDKS